MENKIKLADLTFRPFIPAARIEEAVANVAEQINAKYVELAKSAKQPPIVLGVLNGSFVFLADLVRHFDFLCEICFVKLSSYSGCCTTGDVRQLIGLNCSLKGRDVIVVEDIVDTGVSITHLVADLQRHEVASSAICTLFYKPKSYKGAVTIDYAAMEIGSEFIVGYGLDYNELGREFKDIYIVDNE